MTRRTLLALAVALTFATGCRAGAGAARVSAAAPSLGWYDPSRDLGPLFQDVQLSGIFPDSKTFADARPLRDPAAIVAGYSAARATPGFNLRAFVEAEFELPRAAGEGFQADTAGTSRTPSR